MTLSFARSRDALGNVAIYNPDLLSKEELIAYFSARRPLLSRILEDMGREGSAQHHLLIGTRGMGKTTLLKRIRFAVEDDAHLWAKWYPLSFPEEQYNVGRLSDLYLNCVDALSDALEGHGKAEEAKALDAKVAALEEREEGVRCKEALSILLGASERMGKGFVLLLDNIDILLDRMKEQSWAFRELLSREKRLLVIGASASHPEDTYSYGASFYDFFKVHELRGLPEKEARELILHLSDLRGTAHVRRVVEKEPARLRTLHTLSGGNPRTLVLLYFVLMQSVEGDARTDLERLLDQITPLYKAKIEVLAPQAQKVLDAVAVHWHPVTAAEVAARTQYETGVVSSQLTRLVREGIVEKTATPSGTKTAFQVAERLLNIWYLMRQSRRQRQRLVWLVEFLRMFYGHQELPEHARGHLVRGTPEQDWERMRHAEYGLALADAIGEGKLKHALESSAMRTLVEDSKLRERLKELVDLDGEDAALRPVVDKHVAAVELRERILAAKVRKEGWDAEAFADLLGGSVELDRDQKRGLAEVIETLDAGQIEGLEQMLREEVVRWREMLRDVDLLNSLRQAFRDGYMDSLSDVEGADAASEVLKVPVLPVVAILFKLDVDFDQRLLEEALKISNASGGYAAGWTKLAAHLVDNSERYDLAELACRKAIAMTSNITLSWSILGTTLHFGLERFEEAEQAYRRAIELDPDDAFSWNNLGELLATHLERYEEAENAFRRAAICDDENPFPWLNLGLLLETHFKRYGEAEVAYREAINRDDQDSEAWYCLGRLLQIHLKRYDEAEQAFRAAIALDGQFVSAWLNLGNVLRALKRYEESEQAFRKTISLDDSFAPAWNNLGNILHRHLKRHDEAEYAYRQAIDLDSNYALAWYNLGNLQGFYFRRYEESERCYRQSIALNDRSAHAWNDLGRILHCLERFDESERAYRQAIALANRYAQPWYHLGNLLNSHFKKADKAEDAYRKAIDLAPRVGVFWNDLAWHLYLTDKVDPESEQAARKAIELMPNSLWAMHTLACILARLGKWDEPAELITRIVQEASPEFLDRTWTNILRLFAECARVGKTAESIALLDKIGYGERWLPLRAALSALIQGRSSLLALAPELRTPAESILQELIALGQLPPASDRPSKPGSKAK